MGLLQRLFGPSTPPTATASRPSRARRSRKFRGQLESLEPRQMMAADVAPEILLGSVYFEEATGDDSQGDIIEVTFVGGASGTTMNRLVIDGDKRGDGLTDGDVFFDIADGGYGAFKAVGLNILEADGFVIDSISVADGGSQIIFTFSGFDAGETLKFSVDADEMQYRDVDGDSVNSVVEGAEFERSIMTGEFSAVGYVDITLQGLYWDEFDARRTAAQSATGQVLDLPDDRYSDLQDYTDRTAGAVAHAKQIPLATLSGWVYHDRSNDGVFDRGSEEGIGGVTLELLDENGNPTGITTTTSTEPGKVGYYEFRNLHAGKYGVREVQPTGWLDGKDTPGSHGGTAASETAGRVDRITGATLAYGDDGVEYNFGELLVGSIAGRVSASTTADCKFDDPEILLEGVRIDLLDASGNVLATTFTDALGRYKFEGLAPGEYQIREHQPTEYYDGGERVGSAGGTKYDVDDTYSMFSEILLGSGVDAVDYFFCEHVGPSLSGWVYHDRSNDGIFDRGGEEGIGGVVMELLDENGQPTGITTVTSTVAGKVGYYEFTNLAPGKYGVREYHPDGWLDGKDTPGTHGGVAASETAGRVDRITGAMLAFGDIAQEYNFGELLAGSIAGRVSASRDADCHFDDPHILLAGVKIDLLDDKGQVIATTFTNASGEYQFVDLAPGVYEVHEHQPEGYYNGGRRVGSEGGEKTGTDSISQIVIGSDVHGVQYDFCEKIGVKLSGWVYHDRSNDGIFDRGPEEGIGQVTLKLLDANGSDTGRRAVTDPDGYYEFTDLEAGKYTVMEVHPEGWLDGKDTPGNLGGVSQPSPPGDMISEIMINFGQEAVEYNFGELKPGSIRGHVHADYDGDCIADENEPRLASVKIELRDQAGNVIATTYTNANGEYVFENLRPGNYTVFEHQPEGYFQGGNNIGSGGGTKLAQDLLGNINVGSDQHFVDYNFCEKPPAKLSGYVFVDGPPIFAAGGLPDDVWTIRDGTRTSDDRYLAGVTLELRHGVSGDPIMGSEALAGYYGSGPIRIVTDANGYYEFAGLPAGTYAVVQVHPAGLIDGIDTEGTLGGLVVNPVGSPSDTASQGNPSQQSAIQQMREQYGNDIIFRIALTAGQHSQENNFSEIETTFIFIPPDNPLPPKPPVFLNPGQALAQQLYPLLAPVKPEPLLYGGSSGVNGYTWHLSLVNAGYPRSMAATEGLMHLTSTHMSASAWHDVDLGHAVWVFGETDPYGSDDGTTEAIFGHPRGIPVVGDWDGDGTDEIGVFIEGKWYLDLNGNGRWDEGDIMAELGNGGDLPTTGDWDGDGKTDIAIFGPVWAGDPWAIENEPGLPDAANTPGPLSPKAKNMPPETDEATLGHRTLQRTDRGQARRDLIDHVFHYGTAGDQPITGDWNGDGIATIGVFRGGVWYLDMDGDGQFTDADATIDFGIDGTAVVGDWNGDGTDEIGVFSDGKWTLDSNGNREVDALDRVFEMGKAGDRPISGDWNGDGVDEPAVYTPAIDEAMEREAA